MQPCRRRERRLGVAAQLRHRERPGLPREHRRGTNVKMSTSSLKTLHRYPDHDRFASLYTILILLRETSNDHRPSGGIDEIADWHSRSDLVLMACDSLPGHERHPS